MTIAAALTSDGFFAFFQSFGIAFGSERSCKLSEHGVFHDRRLVSFGRSVLAGDDETLVSRLCAITAEFGLPAERRAWIDEAHRGAGVVHFGYERQADAVVCKIYFEYVRDARQALAAPSGPAEPVVVHRALKWRVGDDGVAETLYRLLPYQGRPPRARLDPYRCGGRQDAIVAVADAILTQALQRADEAEVILLEVADTDTTRRSFDLQFYDACLTLGAVGDDLLALGTIFGLTEHQVREGLGDHTALLGHIAGGLDAGGRAFVTLYYGARQYGPRPQGAGPR